MFPTGLKRLAAGLLGAVLLGGVPAAAQAPAGWTSAPGSIVNPPSNTDLDAWNAYKGKSPKPSVDEHLDDPVLKGAIDIHAHFGPDAYDRQWDAFEIARMAQARGMRGLVFKNHWSESAGLAWLVRKYGEVPGVRGVRRARAQRAGGRDQSAGGPLFRRGRGRLRQGRLDADA
ncbi:MAG: DUF6282 family protein [Sphingomonas sp.]